MQLSANHIHFFISYAVAFLVFGLIANWYIWPSIKDRPLKSAIPPFLLYACLRVNGLMFLMPGACLAGAAESLCGAHRLWRSDGGSSRAPGARMYSLRECRRGADVVGVQCCWASRPHLREPLHVEGSGRSGLSRRLLLPGSAERAGYGGRPCLDFRLLAEADRARMTAAYASNERHEISDRSASCVP